MDRALEERTSGWPVGFSFINLIGCSVKWEGRDGHWMPPEAWALV
ncbi:MAG: hypothetical protein NWE88_09590 [Candidatus Bathyarchaeota archaeon]|nr:hypothetical protein [Candidatus Bathyarchaeota archaeon]